VTLALLRLYLIFPDRAAARVVQRALLRALLQLPEHDFWLALHLVPERMQADDGCAALVTLAGHLEAGKFKEFWAAASAPAAATLTAVAPGFDDAARGFIARSLGAAYRSLPAAQLADALKLDAGALGGWLASAAAPPGWRVEGDVVHVPLSEANDPQPQKGAETIPFSKLEGLFKTVAA
jgi:hypothetical protein